LQKQKQIASGQPRKGCDAPGENKKQKQNQKQQSTSSIAAVCRKKKTNNKTTARASKRHDAHDVGFFQLYLP